MSLETLLAEHDWGHSLAASSHRLLVDAAMKTDADAVALWEKYCPWSATNGGYVQWAKTQPTGVIKIL